MSARYLNQHPVPWPWEAARPNLSGLLDNWAAGDHVYLVTAGGLVQGVLSASSGSIVRLAPATISTGSLSIRVTIANTPYSAILTSGRYTTAQPTT